MEVAFIFIILSTILLWFVIGSKGRWGAKTAAIFITLMFSLNIVRSLGNLSGWPAHEKLPEKFLVHWVMVEEPNKASDEDGDIYLWVNNLEKEDKELWKFFEYDHNIEPRAYRVSYSAEMHEIAMSIRDRLLAGEPVIGISSSEFLELNSPGQLLENLSDSKRQELGSASIYNHESEDTFFYGLPITNVAPKSTH